METKQYNSLFSFIWNIANDVLVHAFEKGDYKKIILPFMVLRRIDVLLEPTKEKVLAKKEFCDKNGIVERILIVADKFQTGYDQPLLHTMYVDKMHIFYSLLVKKLPKLRMDDDTDGLLDNVDFDKYRIVKEEERAIVLENENAEVNPVPVGQGGRIPQPEPDSLSNIIKDFNESFGGIAWKNEDEVQRQISELPTRIAKSVDFVNAVKNGDKQAAQITFNDDIITIVAGMLEEKTEFVQTYFGNPDFQNFVNARVFSAVINRLGSM